MHSVQHTFEPIYDKNSSVLILGSFPSVKSREYGFYYGNKQNRFWKLLSFLTNYKYVPSSKEDKILMLINNGIALWDVVYKCDIEGSSDSSIKNVIPCDLNIIINNSSIKNIYANGTTAYSLYMKYCLKNTNRKITKLPSTSPANAKYSFEDLIDSWKIILT